MVFLKKSRIFLFIVVFFLAASLPFYGAGEEKSTIGTSRIDILSPKPGEVIPEGTEVLLEYKLVMGLRDNGDHVHVYVDGKNEGTARRSPRSLGKLSPGKHQVLMKISNKDHDTLNVETTVVFQVGTPANR